MESDIESLEGQADMIIRLMKKTIIFIIGMIAGILLSGHALISDIKKLKKDADKNWKFYMLYDNWFELKQRGKSLKNYFHHNNFHDIAIYGMGKIGLRLYGELKKEGVNVCYVIDRNGLQTDLDIKCFTPENNLPKADVIIVTVVQSYDEIVACVQSKVNCPILSIEEIISDCVK